MVIHARRSSPNYVWLEASFLFFLSFMIALISDLEYSAYEENDISKFTRELGYRVVTEFLEMVLYGLYYWGFLKRYVFRRNVIGIIVCTLSFIALYHLFNKYIINWAVVHADFVSDGLRKRSLRRLNAPDLLFPVNYLLISVIFPLLGLAFLVRSLTQETQLKALREQQFISELNYLKAQIHPHFFFNTLNNIYALALKQSTDTAPMVARLGELMRYILEEASQKTVPLAREITFLSSYIALAKIRYQTTIQIQFDVQGVRPEYLIEPLLLLPFIENAFKHGLEQETASGFVDIVLCQTQRELILDVSNSKPSAQKTDETTGIGLANVSKRLELLYPSNYQLEVKDDPDSYRVTLTLSTT
jgi:hypothetical protein